MEMNNLILTVAEYLLLILFCSLSIAIAAFALFLLHKLNKNRNFNAAPSLIVFLSSLGVCCVTLTVQYTLLFLSTIFNTYLYSLVSPTQFIFWVGLVPSSLIPAAPICVFFLSLDRLLIILKPMLYNSSQRIKQMVAAFSLISVISLFTMHLVFNLSDRPSTERPECISFGCLTSDDSRQFYALNRLAVALPNFLAGTAFLAALFSFRRRLERISGGSNNNNNKGVPTNNNNNKGVPTNLNLTPTNTAEINNTDSRKMSDHLVFYCVLFELVLDLLPNFVYFLLTTFDVNISVYVGAFRSMSYALCAFCSVFAHTAILWNIFKSTSICYSEFRNSSHTCPSHGVEFDQSPFRSVAVFETKVRPTGGWKFLKAQEFCPILFWVKKVSRRWLGKIGKSTEHWQSQQQQRRRP